MLNSYKNAKSIAQNLIEELKRDLKDRIKTASNETQKAIFNQYCESNKYNDDMVVDMEELPNYLPYDPMDIVRMFEGSNFSSSDDYFSFDGYGNIYSYNYVEDNNAFCLTDIAGWLIDSGERTEEEDVDEILDNIEAVEDLMKIKKMKYGRFEELEKLTGEEVLESDSETESATLSDGTEWKVLTEEEADKVAREAIRNSLWAFDADFILAHCDENITDKTIETMRLNLCESCNDIIFLMIGGEAGFEDFAMDAIDADGRGHFITWYDGVEHEAGDFYAYRIN